MYVLPPSPLFLLLPQPLRSASSLTCILREPLWHICPRLVMPSWFCISVWMLSIAAPADYISDFPTENRRVPSGKNREIWFVYPACLDTCPSQIPGFCKLNGCLSLDSISGGEPGGGWKDGGQRYKKRAEWHLFIQFKVKQKLKSICLL